MLIFAALCAPGIVLSEVTAGKPGALPVVGRLAAPASESLSLATGARSAADLNHYSLEPEAYGDENIAVIHSSAASAPVVTLRVPVPAAPSAAPAAPAASAPPAPRRAPAPTLAAAPTPAKRSGTVAATALVGAPPATVIAMPRAGLPGVVTLVADGARRALPVRGDTVAEVLNANHIHVGNDDRVHPARGANVPADRIIRIERVQKRTQRIYSRIASAVVRRKDANLARGKERIVAAGSRGMRETTLEFTTVDGKAAGRRVVRQRVSHAARPRIVAVGTRPPLEGFSAFAARAFSRTEALAHGALSMIATAYTAYCSSCSGTGRGATGMAVHRGVVAVDPRVIPLGSRLFIPGYGHAIAGDTGGDIVGRRIDLAFDSNAEAIQFGRRPVTIFVLDKKGR